MKKGLLFFVLGVFTASIAFGMIQTQHVEVNLATAIKQIRKEAKDCSDNIEALKNNAADVVTANSGVLDSDDKTNLTTMNGKVNTAVTALDDLVAYIDNTWTALND